MIPPQPTPKPQPQVPPRSPLSPVDPSRPVTWQELAAVNHRISELYELIHQVNHFQFVQCETLLSSNLITRESLAQTRERLSGQAEKIVTKINELRSSSRPQREKVFEAIPHRIRPEELGIPQLEFMKSLRLYLKEQEGKLTSPELMDIVLFYGLPRALYEKALKDRGEFYLPPSPPPKATSS